MTPLDWRGTPITPGALVVYGSGVGSHSIAMVEGEVIGFTESGRVNVRVIRRSYGGGWVNDREVVHVGPDRLTVVTALPPSEKPTAASVKADAVRRLETYRASRGA